MGKLEIFWISKVWLDFKYLRNSSYSFEFEQNKKSKTSYWFILKTSLVEINLGESVVQVWTKIDLPRMNYQSWIVLASGLIYQDWIANLGSCLLQAWFSILEYGKGETIFTVLDHDWSKFVIQEIFFSSYGWVLTDFHVLDQYISDPDNPIGVFESLWLHSYFLNQGWIIRE